MSGYSTSITWITSLEAAQTSADDEIEVTELPPVETEDEDCLCALSVNNRLEYRFRALLAKFGEEGLSYFRPWDEIVEDKFSSFSALLYGESLNAAIEGLHNLLSKLRNSPNECITFWNSLDNESLDEIRFVTAPWHYTFIEAQQWIDNSEDGDMFEDVIAFLQAHRLCLERAMEKGLAALYAVSFY
jgi:hypothetical protein